jgi:hypothetical protein
LAGLGHQLWGKRLQALEEAKLAAAEGVEEELDEAVEETEEAPRWTSEAVVRSIEHAIMHGALLIRRARWLCLLSESSLAWEVCNAGSQRKNVLLFKNGAVDSRQELSAEKATPLSAGSAKRIPERQKIFDLTTYERLRVVTTEMRRLVGEGRKIELRVRPTAILSGRQLAKLLPWV